MARQEEKGLRKSGDETRLEQRQRKTYAKAQEALKEGKAKKGMRKMAKTAKQQERMKKRSKGETGIYPIVKGIPSGTTYGSKVKTSALRKKAKKNR